MSYQPRRLIQLEEPRLSRIEIKMASEFRELKTQMKDLMEYIRVNLPPRAAVETVLEIDAEAEFNFPILSEDVLAILENFLGSAEGKRSMVSIGMTFNLNQ